MAVVLLPPEGQEKNLMMKNGLASQATNLLLVSGVKRIVLELINLPYLWRKVKVHFGYRKKYGKK